MVKVFVHIAGVEADNGTFLIGGEKKSTAQEVSAANTVIQYTRKKSKFKDVLKIQGPTDEFLRVVVSILSRF